MPPGKPKALNLPCPQTKISIKDVPVSRKYKLAAHTVKCCATEEKSLEENAHKRCSCKHKK